MSLWLEVLRLVKPFRRACERKRTFLNLLLALVGMLCLPDGFGVTSFVRSGSLKARTYGRLLNLFNGRGLHLGKLRGVWLQIVLRNFPLYRSSDGRAVYLLDGTDVAKSGRKMPGMHLLFNHSETKHLPSFFQGHSLQMLNILAKSGPSNETRPIPLTAVFDGGVVSSNRDKRTKVDHGIRTFCTFAAAHGEKAVLLADAGYCSHKAIETVIAAGHSIVTRAKTNTVAYLPAPPTPLKKRGRPKKYGNKVHLSRLFESDEGFIDMPSPVYSEGKSITVRARRMQLLWRPVGRMMNFVLVSHPDRGNVILATDDLNMPAEEALRLYGFRFKIEGSIKVAKSIVKAFSYRFWMKGMKKTSRWGKQQHLHRTSDAYRLAVKQKFGAYKLFVQVACIAQGLLQYLSLQHSGVVWSKFRSWLRTMQPKQPPSELVTAMALSACWPEFLQEASAASTMQKYLLENVAFERLRPPVVTQKRCA